MPPAVEMRSLNLWTSREVPQISFLTLKVKTMAYHSVFLWLFGHVGCTLVSLEADAHLELRLQDVYWAPKAEERRAEGGVKAESVCRAARQEPGQPGRPVCSECGPSE